MKCTWVDCNLLAVHAEVGKDGKAWANLCNVHHEEIERLYEMEPAKIMSAWVKAQGGPKKAAERMMRG